jgi:DNA-binding GntR family transcriptional regulator
MLDEKIQQLGFKPSVLGQRVAGVLAEAILDNDLRGGEQLVEMELQKKFGISRSPLREAFRDLDKMGLVEIIPHRGAFVRKVTGEDIRQTYPIRAVLESLAAAEAHRRMTAEDLARLSGCMANMEKYFRSDDKINYWKQHFIFHEIFINASGNGVLIDILRNVRMRTHRYRFSLRYYQDNFRENLSVHQAIHGMFMDRRASVSKLSALVKRHIEESSEKFIGYIETREIE